MQESTARKLVINFFIISLLLHLLFFLATFLHFKPPPQEQKKSPNDYVQSYVYKGALKPSAQKPVQTQQTQNSTKSVRKETPTPNPQSTTLSQKVEKATKDAITLPKNTSPQKSLMASSLAMLRSDHMQQVMRPRDTAEPILLVGDEHEIADPFIQLIGRALSAYFRYPELEGRMGIQGRVMVEMTLHPEGYFDDIQIVSSSNNPHLDAAALYAVNKAPRVAGADMFIQKPKRFVVGFMFVIK